MVISFKIEMKIFLKGTQVLLDLEEDDRGLRSC